MGLLLEPVVPSGRFLFCLSPRQVFLERGYVAPWLNERFPVTASQSPSGNVPIMNSLFGTYPVACLVVRCLRPHEDTKDRRRFCKVDSHALCLFIPRFPDVNVLQVVSQIDK